MKKCNCPECGKELIRLEPFEPGVYEFWCNSCDIDINITKNKEVEYPKVKAVPKKEVIVENQKSMRDVITSYNDDDIKEEANKTMKMIISRLVGNE